MKSVRDVDVAGQRVLLRVDLNSTVEDGEIQLTPRIEAHSKTLEYLTNRDAEVIVLAHQGRPGRDDFLHLNQHAELLENLLGGEVKFVNDITGNEAEKAIENLEPGDILLLDNLRMHPDELRDVSPEEHAESELVSKLSEWCDLYVNDAFSVCHRNHASMTGFPLKMRAVVGPQLEKELKALEKLENPPRPVYFVLGGDKPKDAIAVMKRMFGQDRLDLALLGGVVGEVFLQTEGVDLGSKNYDLGELEDLIDGVLEHHRDKLILPVDVAYRKKGKREEILVDELPVQEKIFDIGSGTLELFKQKVQKAQTIVLSGPLGKFEESEFRKGTEDILEALAGLDKFTLVGGGDTSEAADQLGYDLENDFSHVSLAGGAFISYLSGKKLPALEALR